MKEIKYETDQRSCSTTQCPYLEKNKQDEIKYAGSIECSLCKYFKGYVSLKSFKCNKND